MNFIWFQNLYIYTLQLLILSTCMQGLGNITMLSYHDIESHDNHTVKNYFEYEEHNITTDTVIIIRFIAQNV